MLQTGFGRSPSGKTQLSQAAIFRKMPHHTSVTEDTDSDSTHGLQVLGSKKQLSTTRSRAQHCKRVGAQPSGEAAPAACQPEEGAPVCHACQPPQSHAGRPRQTSPAGRPGLAVQGRHAHPVQHLTCIITCCIFGSCYLEVRHCYLRSSSEGGSCFLYNLGAFVLC